MPECEQGRGHRRGEASFWGTDIFSRITPLVACCPDCHRALRAAPVQPRAVYRPVWPAIFTCPCGFFKGFRQTPEDIEAAVYREIDRETRLAFELEQLGDEADFEV